jgi:hypothetical protein
VQFASSKRAHKQKLQEKKERKMKSSASAWWVVTGAATAALLGRVAADGEAGCPCLTSDGGALDPYRNDDGDLIYAGYVYPDDYGIGCKLQDENLAPYCLDSTDDNPEWCYHMFCYVDVDNCDLPLKYASGYFPASGLYYSFQTCGDTGTFDEWFNDSGDDDGTHELVDMADLVENYVLTIRNNLQDDYAEFSGVSSPCDYDSSCPCDTCEANADWGGSVGFTTTILVPEADTTPLASTTCMAQTLRSYFLKVAGAEYQDASVFGTLYAGFQDDGVFTQWPAIDWCPTSYDPRFRPWFSTSVTNPKVLILTIDISGSMAGSRIALALEAAKAVLETCAWKDQVGFVLFNSAVVSTRSPAFCTDDERDDMKAWLDLYVTAGGNTEFVAPLTSALAMIDADAGCSNVILFLTDGVATFTEQNFVDVQAEAAVNDVVLFTFALGDGKYDSTL